MAAPSGTWWQAGTSTRPVAPPPRSRTTTDHLFFYGSRDLDKTIALVVTATGPPGEQVVYSIAMSENYLLGRYDRCTELDLVG